MSKKFIDAEITENAIQQLCNKYNIAFNNGHGGFGDKLKETLDNIPAADVQEVRRGKWEIDDITAYFCTKCGYWQPYTTPYCPNCGARMDGEI